MSSKVEHPPRESAPGPGSHAWLSEAIRLVIAPVLCLGIGFFTADFLLSGIYTWPRTGRIVVLTLTAAILAYEFVFKEQRARFGAVSPDRPVKALVYSCLVPYGIGFATLMGLVGLTL